MSRDPIVADENAPLSRVATLLEEHGIKRVPVVRGSSLVDIVNRADLLHAIVSARPDGAASGDEAIRRSVMTRLADNIGLEGMNATVTVVPVENYIRQY
jgi:predicted transcriptional regulator